MGHSKGWLLRKKLALFAKREHSVSPCKLVVDMHVLEWFNNQAVLKRALTSAG